MNDILPHRALFEGVMRDQPGYFASAADNDLSFHRKPANDLDPKLCLADWSPDDKNPGRADVDGIEVLQFSGEERRPEGLVAADVDASEKNNEGHRLLEREGRTKEQE